MLVKVVRTDFHLQQGRIQGEVNTTWICTEVTGPYKGRVRGWGAGPCGAGECSVSQGRSL